MVHRTSDNITGEIRAAWQTGTPLANDRFRDQIEKVLKVKVGYAKRGRPRKKLIKGLSYLLLFSDPFYSLQIISRTIK